MTPWQDQPDEGWGQAITKQKTGKQNFEAKFTNEWSVGRIQVDIHCLACTVFFQISNQLVTLKGQETAHKNPYFWFVLFCFFLKKSEDHGASPWEAANPSSSHYSPTSPDSATRTWRWLVSVPILDQISICMCHSQFKDLSATNGEKRPGVRKKMSLWVTFLQHLAAS